MGSEAKKLMYDRTRFGKTEWEYLETVFGIKGKNIPKNAVMYAYNYGKNQFEVLPGKNMDVLKVMYQMSCRDLMFTPNLYRKGERTEKNLIQINAIALDVDYKKNPNYAHIRPEGFFWNVIVPELVDWGKIPCPTYIETGHQLRLIFCLKEPIICKNGRSVVIALKETLKRLSEGINDVLDCHCEPQKINSFFRMPGSVNSKDGSRVKVLKTSSEEWTLQELMDEYLPELPSWYENWKKNKSVKSHNKIHNTYQLWMDRKELFKSFREYEQVNREHLLYLYGMSLRWTNYSGDYIGALLDFNEGFVEPLSEKEIRTKFRYIATQPVYQFKNSTIQEYIGVECQELLTKKEAEKLRREEAGETRKQLTEAKYQSLLPYFEANYSIAKIVEMTGASESTVKRCRRRFKAENGIEGNIVPFVIKEPSAKKEKVSEPHKEATIIPVRFIEIEDANKEPDYAYSETVEDWEYEWLLKSAGRDRNEDIIVLSS